MADDPNEPLRVRFDERMTSNDDGYIRFLRRPGDPVRMDEVIAELELDKCCLELTAPFDGVVESIRGEGDVRQGDELYSLRPGPVAPRPAPPPPPPPPPVPKPEVHLPTALHTVVPWHAGPLLASAARMRSDAPAADREAALLSTALVRAAIAVPKLSTILLDPADGRVAVRLCDVDPGAARWSHLALGPADDPLDVLAARQPGPGDREPTVTIVRLHNTVALTMAVMPLPHRGLVVTIGPAVPQPVVAHGELAVRTMSSLHVAFRPWPAVDVANLLIAAIVEQLTVV